MSTLVVSCQFYLLAEQRELGLVEVTPPWLSQFALVPAPDDELLPPVKKFPLAEEVAEPRSVDAPVELADWANALWIT
jgi:hypothetical protein